MNLLDFRARFQMNPRREIQDFARFWAYKVARNHEKSVKKVLLSLNRNLRFTMKKKQKSREIATGPLSKSREKKFSVLV